MSHFSTIKTKIKSEEHLIEALEELGYDVELDQKLINPIDHQHEQVNVHIAIDKDIGFKWNDITDSYELVTDVQTWDEPIPVERFLDKLTQLYASKMIVSVSKQKGYEVVEYAKLNDGSIEVVCERWN
tara:strand:- start:3483 stop:3866 length:384 start_codon:yes stop_codon:yes gene_type:complete